MDALRSWGNIGFASLLTLSVGVVGYSHRALDSSVPGLRLDPKETYVSSSVLRLLSLSYRNVVADYYWLRLINHYGDERMEKFGYPNAIALLKRTVDLDPLFAQAYWFAGTALVMEDNLRDAAVDVLRAGGELLPGSWRVQFSLGFNEYFYYQDFAAAAKSFGRCAQSPGCPPQTGPLATRLAAEAGNPAIGLKLIDILLESGGLSEEAQTIYLGRRQLLLLEQQMQVLQGAVDMFRERYGNPPGALQDLVRAGLVEFIPQMDPIGGRFSLSSEGTVLTTSEDKRLRLSDTNRTLLR